MQLDTKKKILFISHQASRTGAPMLLLNLIKWLVLNKKEYIITVLFVKGGDLEAEFSALVKTYNLESYKKYKNFFLKRIYKRIFELYFFNKNWNLIFSNTIFNGLILKQFANKHIPIISYVHELKGNIDSYWYMAKDSLILSNHFICGSKFVESTLSKDFSITTNTTSVVRSFIDIKAKNYTKNNAINNTLRRDLNIDSKCMVVGMLGSFTENKGVDLFIKTAQKLKSQNIHFIWVGANNSPENKKSIDKAINDKLKISFIPPTTEYLQYYHLLDIKFLSSREDPYPLVMVEASAFGIPIICFKDAGGAQEFIDEKTGWLAPFEDVDFVVNILKKINNDRSCFSKNTAYIKEKSYNYHDINVNAQKITDQIHAAL